MTDNLSLWESAASAVSADEDFEKGQRAKARGQAQVASAIPLFTRQTIATVLRMLARTGVEFAFVPTREGHPNVKDRLPPATKEILATHPQYLGTLATEQKKAGAIYHVGYAIANEAAARGRPVKLWRIR